MTPRPAAPTKKGAALKDAISLLIDEAREIQRDQRLPKTTPDFVSRFDREIPSDEMVKAIITPCHKDRFIDAYVRWQLTSFNPDLPPLSDQQMLGMMAGAPPMLDNPRASADMISLFEKSEQVKKPLANESQRLRDAVNDLDYRSKSAEEMNVPADGWRDWIAGKLSAKGPRRLQWLIERAAATASAGWAVRSVKMKMTKEFKLAGSESLDAFTQHDRDRVAEQARRLIGLHRRAVNQITFLADGSINVSFSSNAIDKEDVDKWIASLPPTAATR